MATKAKHDPHRIGFLNLLIMSLSIYVLAALLVDTFFTLPVEIQHILKIVDDFICFIFLYDFAYRFYHAENKLKFMRWGWIDLISSIPTLEALRPGRALRLIRLFRVLRAFRSTRHLVSHIFERRTHGAFSAASIIALLMIIFSSVAILQVEHAPDSNIKTAEDALWWAFTTITSVGYGDKYPVTTEGRVIAAFLMVSGVMLIGTFTGFVASWFLGGKKNEEVSKPNDHNNA
ncbi:MAG: ion transporter [Ginsengibacter sp.]